MRENSVRPESMNSVSLEIGKVIYISLRDEILEKMKFSNQLVSYKLISIGSITAFVIAKYDKVLNYGKKIPSSTDYLFLYYASVFTGIALAISFDLALYQNNRAIIQVGTYMREHLEKWLKDIARIDNLVMWEEFLFINPDVKISKRTVYNIFEIVNYLMTILITIFGFSFLFSLPVKKWVALSVVFPILILMECLIAYKGFVKK